MHSPFKLLVFVIITFLLALLYFYLVPLYLWQEKPADKIKTVLEKAETMLGHSATESVVFAAGHTVQASAYESASRSIVFECNSELYCCAQGTDCEKAIEWDNSGRRRYFSFKEGGRVTVSARCRHEEIHICKVFIGTEPGQIKIDRIELEKKELDLSEENILRAFFEVENSGEKEIIAVQGIAGLYRKQLSDEGKTERVLVGESLAEFPLSIGEKYIGELVIEIEENGEFELETIFREKRDETNYEKRLFEVEAFGKAEGKECSAMEMQILELEKCVYLLPCKCKSVIKCEEIWRNELGIPAGEKFELVSADEGKGEMVLKYTDEYKIPEWCDPGRMECESYCRHK